MKGHIVVRKASVVDLAAVARLEYAIFGREGIIPFQIDHFAACLAAYPEGFFVAEQEKKVVGYVYAQIVFYNMAGSDEAGRWSSFEEVIARGHKPAGNYHLGINIGSAIPGAGKLLVQELLALGHRTGKPVLGMSRVSGFAQYVEGLVSQGVLPAEICEQALNTVAVQYVLACAQMVSGKVKLASWCPGICEPAPFMLPPPSVRDPVLCKYLLNKDVAVYAVLPRFLDDAASMGYSVLIGPA